MESYDEVAFAGRKCPQRSKVEYLLMKPSPQFCGVLLWSFLGLERIASTHEPSPTYPKRPILARQISSRHTAQFPWQ